MTPKAVIKTEKENYVNSLSNELKEASSVVLVNFEKMNVSSQQELKSQLAKSNAKMKVAKNTLTKIAIEKAGLPNELGTDEILKGQTAIVMASDDPVSPIQILGKYNKTSDLAAMKAGFVDGNFQNSEGLIKISKLPSKQELYAQVVGSVMSPLYGVVNVLNANMQKLVYVLSEASKK